MRPGNAEGFTVRVLKVGSDLTAGIGFLVTDRHIITCAHVVNVALGRNPREQADPGGNVRVEIEFPKLGRDDGAPSRGCRVEKWVPPPRSGLSGGDIAGLVLARGDLPEQASPARLLDEAIPRGSVVDVFGYPGSPPRPEHGANSRLTARGTVGHGLVQLDADGDTAIRVQAGFSGSPVVVADEAGDAVVGMVTVASGDGRGTDAYSLPVAALCAGWPEVLGPLTLPPCPYKGLSPFTADDAARSLYVGREADVAELRQMLKRQALVVVAGSSGVGKSSLIAAGLAYSMKSDGWSVASVRPGADPVLALVRALVEVERPGAEPDLGALDDYAERLRTEGLTSTGARLAQRTGKPVLVCVDPLEEILDTGCETDARAEFLQMMLSLRPVKDRGFRLVCALRSDFLSHLYDHPDAAPSLRNKLHLLSPLGRRALERIIEEPALALGVKYESALVSQIAEDAGDGSSLPLLEWALFDMWRHLRSRIITLSDYHGTGRVAGALARHADQAYRRLAQQPGFDEAQVRNVLLTLVRTGPHPARQAVPRAELTPRQLAVASALISERLLACHTDDLRGDVLEIAHEALLAQWPQLAGWIADDRRFLDWRTRMRDQVSALLQESEITEAREWLATRAADIDPSVREMIERSRTHYEEQLQRLDEARADAEAAARLSEALRLAILSDHVGQARGTSSSASIALAIESLVKAPTLQGDLALRKSLAQAAQAITLLTGQKGINEVTYSPDGTLIAAARADGNLSVFSDGGASSWERKHLGAANSASFSPDGKWVACGHDNGVGVVLTTNDGVQRCRLSHEDAVKIVRFSPDGSVIATACDDGTARLYDAVLGGKLHQFGHAGSVRAIAFSDAGDVLATASDDGTARLYQVASGSLRHSIAHPGPVTAIALSPDGRLLVTGCDDGTARVYDATTGARQREFPGRDPVKAVAVSHDGSFIAIAGGRPKAGVMRVLDAASGTELAVHQDQTLLTWVAFSHDDSLVATASRGGLVRLFNLPEGSEYSTITHEGPVTSACFSPDAIRIVTAGADGKALVSGRVTGDERLRVPHNRRVTSVAFSPDEKLLATGGAGGRVMLSDWAAGAVIREITRHGTVTSVSISPNARHLATGDTDGCAALYLTSTGGQFGRVDHNGSVRAVAFSPDGEWLGTGSSDRTARIILVASPGNRRTLSHPGAVNAVAFSPDSRWIATACVGQDDTGLAQVFKVSGGARVSRVPHEGWVNWVAFSPDSRWVATASDDGTARVFNAETGQERHRVRHDRRVGHVAFSPDGQWVATASDDGTACVFDPETGDERDLLDHDGSWVNWVAFSPDGRWLATACDDGTARVFDPVTGIERHRLVHREAVNMVSFSPDSHWVATASDDGTARVSPIAMDVLLDTARNRMTRPLSPAEARQFGLTQSAPPRRAPREQSQEHRASKRKSPPRLTQRDYDWYRLANFAVLEVAGEIDVYTAPRLREYLIDLVNKGKYNIIVDIERVEFLDSTGLGVLVGGLKRVRAHDGYLSLVCTQERILKIFRITGHTKTFGIYDTIDEARAYMNSVVLRL